MQDMESWSLTILSGSDGAEWVKKGQQVTVIKFNLYCFLPIN